LTIADLAQLLLLDLLLTAGLPWPTILFTLFLDEVMIVVGLVGALVATSYKWGYFTFGMLALFGVAWNVVWVARKHAFILGPNIHRTFLLCGVWTIFLWFLYPIAWGLSEGGNVIHPDSEAVFYGVLDILAKPAFGLLLLWGHRNIDPATLGLQLRDYDGDVAIHEKRTTAAAANNGVAGKTPAATTTTV
jgi:bacteriorhodopsin